MTQEDKDLLLKDLSARLPYGVKVAFFNEDLTYHSEPKTLIGIECINNLNYSSLEDEDGNTTIVEFVKPYLFPMSYIDVNEKLFAEYITTLTYDSNTHSAVPTIKTFDFYNKYQIDYRGLIPLGLALDATGLNIY